MRGPEAKVRVEGGEVTGGQPVLVARDFCSGRKVTVE